VSSSNTRTVATRAEPTTFLPRSFDLDFPEGRLYWPATAAPVILAISDSFLESPFATSG
jgi:hypothetical protein